MQAAHAALQGTGGIVFVRGEAGIGKSRIIDDLLNGLPAESAQARANCDHLSAPRPYGPLLDLAGSLGRSASRELEQALTGADPLGNAGHILLRLQTGTVLVIEDLQNADPASIDVLKYLVRRIDKSGLLIVCTYRPEEVPLDHPVTELFLECPAECSRQFELPALSREETAALCAQQLVPVEDIYRLTNGHPLLVTEVLRKGYKAGQPLPEAVNRLAIARLLRLSPVERTWIDLLAAVPPPHSQGLIQALAREFGLEPTQIPVASGFLTAGAKGEFRQNAMRLAVLGQMSEYGLAGLRQRLLAMLQASGDSVGDAECRFRLALEAEDSAAIARLAIPAAKLAEARGDLFDCVGHLTKALPFALTVDLTLHAQISELWACRTAVHEGIGERTISLITRNLAYWKRQKVPQAIGMSYLLLARLLNYRAEHEVAGQTVEEAIASLESGEPCPELISAYALAADLELKRGNAAAAERHIKLAEQAIRQIKDKAAQLELMLAQAVLLVSQGRIAQSWRRFETVFDGASARDLHELAARAQIAACDSALGEFDLALAERWISRPSALRDSPLSNCWKTALLGRLALIAVRRGEQRRATDLARSALDGIAAPPAFAFPARLAETVAAARRGEPGVDSQLERLIDLARRLGDHNLEDTVRLFRIESLFLADRKAEACELWRGLRDPGGTGFARGSRVLWARRLGLDVAPTASVLPGQIALELAGDAAGAAQEWQAAGYPFQGMLARLSAHGDALETALPQARAESEAMDTAAASDAILRMAALHGIALPRTTRKRGPYRASRSHPLGLTQREVDILRMIVDGQSNREIAQRLNRSLRTIEHHVSAILGKMGIENRVQAALYAITHPDIIEP